MEGLGFFHICKLDVLFHRSKVNTLQFFVSFGKLIIRICANLYEISPTFVSFRRHRSGCTVAQPEKIKPDSRSKDVWPGRPPRGGHDAVLRAPHGARAHRPAGAAAHLLHRRADVRPAARARGHERPRRHRRCAASYAGSLQGLRAAGARGTQRGRHTASLSKERAHRLKPYPMLALTVFFLFLFFL